VLSSCGGSKLALLCVLMLVHSHMSNRYWY
jgi:hypothetical protein